MLNPRKGAGMRRRGGLLVRYLMQRKALVLLSSKPGRELKKAVDSPIRGGKKTQGADDKISSRGGV